MRSILLTAAAVALALALVFGVSGCSDYSSASPTTPNRPTALPPADAVTIEIVGEQGAQSFSPNPATAHAGQTVVWHNADKETHHVVLDDGELDAGNVGPGAFSAPMPLVAPGSYHCTIHPSMVGRIAAGQ